MMLASSSYDETVKLWRVSDGDEILTLYGHKNSVAKVAWNANGNWLLTASRDQLIKLYARERRIALNLLSAHPSFSAAQVRH